jgi:HK97 family phage prohead protease
MKLQTKLLNTDALELKFVDGSLKFTGYASVFNGVDAYGDTIEKGAYKSTLKGRERPIRMRWNHYGEVIGKWLDIKEDERGLFVEGELTPNHSKASDVYASLKHGAIDGLSIGYRVKSAQDNPDGTRLLKEIDLVEISVVEEPADLNATIGEIKSVIEECESLKDFEALLRDAGKFSRADATLFVSRMKSMCQRESDAELKTQQALKELFKQFDATASK